MLQEEKKIQIEYKKNLPLINVTLNNKEFTFLLDTGAPTVISKEIYNFLNLKPEFQKNVKDANNKSERQVYTIIPKMNIQGIDFYDIGCIVLNLEAQEFKCYGIDGIIGANQMAKAHWLFNYKEQTVSLLPFESKIDSTLYDFYFNIKTKAQKTPLVYGETIGINEEFTFDTGYTGNIKMNIKVDSLNKIKEVKKYYGVTSVSAYGGDISKTNAIFKSDSIKLSSKTFYNEGIATGNSNLIGNTFFENYQFLIDWRNRKVYFKEIKNQPKKNVFRTYGFSYRFLDKKATVVLIEERDNFPLEIGDEIISINNVDFVNLSDSEICNLYLNFNTDEFNSLNIKIKRDAEYHTFTLNKTL